MKFGAAKRVYNAKLDITSLTEAEQELVSKLLGVKRSNVKSGFFVESSKKKTLADEWRGKSAKRISVIEAIRNARAATR
jgi:hypothetical protein